MRTCFEFTFIDENMFGSFRKIIIQLMHRIWWWVGQTHPRTQQSL
jgi:hypothetical protein